MMNFGYKSTEGIKIYLNDERFRYHTHEIISAFFNAEYITYVTEKTILPDVDLLGVEVSEEGSDFRFAIDIFQNGKQLKLHMFKLSERQDFSDGKDADALNKARRALKAELYEFMTEITGKILPWGSMTGIRPAKIVNALLKLGMSKDEIRNELMQKYSVSENKADIAINVADIQKGILGCMSPEKISLYIGIPFCPTRCLYCSFTSNPAGKYVKVIEGYIDALIYEMEGIAPYIQNSGYVIESIYIGGGTPTSLDVSQLEKLLGAVRRIFKLHRIKEFCVEAGRPDSISCGKLQVLKNSGVTRISINPQSLNDETLSLIGRKHTSRQFYDTFSLARNEGFGNINVDIIAGLPGESFGMFQNTLENILKLSPENITVHTMSVKRASDLKLYSSDYILTDGKTVEKMISYAYENIISSGLNPFYMYRQKNMLGNLENVSYSKPGYESYYNIHIMEEDQTIIAFGAGAVSKFVKGCLIERAFNVKSVEDYLKRKEEMIDRKRIFVYN